MPRIRERTPGVYEITVSTGRRSPKTGKYTQVSQTVRANPMRTGSKGWPKVVQLAAANLLTEVDKKRHSETRYTLSAVIDEYLKHQESRGAAPATLLGSRRRAKVIAADLIGKRDIRKLTGKDFDDFYLRLASTGGRKGEGRHTTTRHHFHALMRAALNQAIRWRYIGDGNPIKEAEAPSLKADTRTPPTPEEVRRLAMAVVGDNSELASLIFVDATTGMRRGEICGLRFSDVDQTTGEAVVKWRCSDLPNATAKTVAVRGNVLKAFPELGVVMLDATKNKTYRRFALDPITLAVIAEQRSRAEERCREIGTVLADDAFIWSQTDDNSEPWRPGRVSGAFRALRDAEKLPHVTLNDLRHFSVTQLLAGGVDPKTVAGRHGHDASVMLRVYASVIPARDRDAAVMLGNVLGNVLGESINGRALAAVPSA